MKTTSILIAIVSLSVLPCVAQSANVMTAPPSTVSVSLREKLNHHFQHILGMTPAQKSQFLLEHPIINKYISNPPTVEKDVKIVLEASIRSIHASLKSINGNKI